MASDADIRFQQQYLAGAGLYAGKVDGKDSKELARAIQEYQRKFGLVVTGQVDFATRTHMASTIRMLSGTGQDWITQEVRDEVIKRYDPGIVAYLSHPEMGPIIAQAAREGRDSNWLRGQLQQTDYWRKTQEATRIWDQLTVTDPGNAAAQIKASMELVQQRAGQLLGTVLEPWRARRIAEDAIRFAWTGGGDTAMLDSVLLNTVKFDQAQPPPSDEGDLGAAMNEVKALAAAQLITISDQTAWNLARKVLRQQLTLAGVEALYAKQAKARFPHLADIIDSGVTLADHVAPIRDQIARTLEISPDEIDFNDRLWRQVIDTTRSDGTHREMTESEALTLARRRGGYWGTAEADERSASLALTLARTFGRIE